MKVIQISNDIRDIVLRLKDLYDSSDPFELCKCLDIIVLISDLGNELLGFFQRTNEGTEILHINSKLNEYERKYICSHELGHTILQPDSAISFFIENPLLIKNKFEIEADFFAAELLLEDEFIEKYKEFTIEQIALSENVPTRLIKLKYKPLELFF
jgi:Zn-dependent peptidase ImmA (M78 family)